MLPRPRTLVSSLCYITPLVISPKVTQHTRYKNSLVPTSSTSCYPLTSEVKAGVKDAVGHLHALVQNYVLQFCNTIMINTLLHHYLHHSIHQFHVPSNMFPSSYNPNCYLCSCTYTNMEEM